MKGIDISAKKVLTQAGQFLVAALIISILLFIIINFYVFSSIVSVNTFLFIFLTLTILTDGLYLFIHLYRRPLVYDSSKVKTDTHKITAVIACYNGADKIGPTIEHLKRQLPAKQIIVVSDASTDNTADVARTYGIKVIVNKENINKAFSVNEGAKAVRTPYTLILDDDVLIGGAKLPTGLLEEGYSAVAFNVLPIKTDTFINALQIFEYRVSMYIGKNLRATAAAVGNVSGAIGLFKTKDLQDQNHTHSGQFAGEDEQRTVLSHIYGTGKGVTYADEVVHTHVPNNLHSLYRQRAYGWSLSVPEMIPLYFKLLFSPKYHYLLKIEKAYNLYIFLTDPLRLLFLWTLFLRPHFMILTFALYFSLNFAMWLKTKRKDQFLVVLIYPIYTLILTVFRQVGNFYWFKVKYSYFKKKHHKRVQGRRLIIEFLLVALIFITTWIISGYHFSQEMSLANKVRSYRLDDNISGFDYDYEKTKSINDTSNLNMPFSKIQPDPGTYIAVQLEKGDTLRAIAHKVVDAAKDGDVSLYIPYEKRSVVDKKVETSIKNEGGYLNTTTSMLLLDSTSIKQAIATAIREMTT